MKKIFSLMLAAAAMCSLSACHPKDDPVDPDDDNQPSQKEQAMVTEDMDWVLDSVLVEYNIDSANYRRDLSVVGADVTGWTYHLHPSTWNFPSDMTFTNGLTGTAIKMSESYGEAYCKYVMTASDDDTDIWQAGYLEYYNDHFAFAGVSQSGWVVMNIVDDGGFKGNNWQFSYNNSESPDTGAIYERTTEFYHLRK